MALVELGSVNKVYYSSGEVTEVLKGLDLNAEKGEMLVIMGPSGSGKTTLLNLLGGIDVPNGGRVMIDGEDISDYNASRLSDFRRRKVGFIFQFYNLIPTLNAKENVELSLETVSKDRDANSAKAEKYLELVGLGDKMRNFPQELSGGEQQRVAIARALAKEPVLILADEPTGNLDGKRERSIMELMKGLQAELGMTFFIVTHNHNLRVYADRVLELDDGRLQSGV